MWLIALLLLSGAFAVSAESIGSLPGDRVGDVEEAQFFFPYGLMVDDEGVLWIVDQFNHKIKKVVDGEIHTVLGKDSPSDLYGFPVGFYRDGSVERAYFNRPKSIWIDGDQLYIVDTENHVIRMYKDGRVYTIAGSGEAGYVNGTRAESAFRSPSAMVKDEEGNIYVADTLNHVIRKINRKGEVSTYAGLHSENGGYENGGLLQAQFNEPSALAFTAEGHLLVLDSGNHVIRKIQEDEVSTYVGYASSHQLRETSYLVPGYVDGHHAMARFNFPKGMILLEDGSLLVADSGNQVIRLVRSDLSVTTVQTPSLDRPVSVCLYEDRLYISDTFAHQVLVLEVQNLEALSDFRDATQGIGLLYQGRPLDYPDIAPFMKEDKLYIPIRHTVEGMGGRVVWSQELRAATVFWQGETWVLSQEDDRIMIYENRMVMCLEEWIDYFGQHLEWNPHLKIIQAK